MKKIFFLSILASIFLVSCHKNSSIQYYSISGDVTNLEGEYVSGIRVHLYEGDERLQTYNGSNYEFNQLAAGVSYTILPEWTKENQSDISTYSMVLLQKMIAQIGTFNIYQQIAADINSDGDISTLDMITIRKCIEEVSDDECNNARFITTDYDGMGNGSIDQLDLPPLSQDIRNSDFYVIRLGEVN